MNNVFDKIMAGVDPATIVRKRKPGAGRPKLPVTQTSAESNKKYRANLRARGIVEFHALAHVDDHAELRALAEKLAAARKPTA